MQSKDVATAAAEAATAVLSNMNANGTRLVLPMLFDAMNQKQKWQTKVGALQQLGALTKSAPAQMKAALPDIVPAVAGCFADAKPQVKVSFLLHYAHSIFPALGVPLQKVVIVSRISVLQARQPNCSLHQFAASTSTQHSGEMCVANLSSILAILSSTLLAGCVASCWQLDRVQCYVIVVCQWMLF